MNNKLIQSHNEQFDLSELSPELKEHIDMLERVRQDFVANVSHELRTPLTVIQGYLETFASKKDAALVPYQKIFNQMHSHSMRMENIINDLLLLSRLENEEQSTADFKKVDVAKLLSSLRDDAATISGGKQHVINLQANEGLLIEGSETELKSLFSNIIINAVKYTPEKGSIDIGWYQDGDTAVFKVTDTGIGIDKEHIPRITERFYRVDKARSRDSGGTGLGLAIAKHVLMRHGAELLIESEPGVGSSFICRFPSVRTFARTQPAPNFAAPRIKIK